MNNLTIGTRLAGGFGLILILMIVMTVMGLRDAGSVAEATNTMMQQPLAKERLIADWYRLIHTSVRRTSAIAKSRDPSLGPFFAEDTAASTAGINELQKKVEPLLETAEEKQLFESMKAARKRYVGTRDAIVALKKEDKFDEANRLLEATFIPESKSYLESLGGLLDMQRKRIDANAVQIHTSYEHNRQFMILFGLTVLAAGAYCAWHLTRGITVPLGRAVDVARAVAGNDLRSAITVDSRDETGQLLRALKSMNEGLGRVVGEVRASSEHITSASSEIAAGNLDLSARTEQQAGSLEETASSMEELTATVKQNADNARQANQLAVTASEVAVRGGAVVGQVVQTMESINASARKIVDIISVIDGIAFQTNILALNAAVEAARAGEQGRGFAVVAGEVRNLAHRSAAAAKEIKELIGDSVGKVDIGSKLVAQAGSTMDEVVASIRRVTDIVAEITAASVEQSLGIEQVNQAIVQMDQVTQQNAALVEQAAAAAAALHEQADALSQAVSIFKLIDDRQAPRARSPGTALRLGV